MASPSDLERSVAELTLAIGLLVRRVRAAAPTRELSWGESAVLGRLDRGGPATTAELARAEAVRPQSMGSTIAELVAKGLVERQPHPTDGRQVHIRLTAEGAAMRRRIKDAKRSWLAQAIAELDPRDQETLLAAGEILRRLAER